MPITTDNDNICVPVVSMISGPVSTSNVCALWNMDASLIKGGYGASSPPHEIVAMGKWSVPRHLHPKVRKAWTLLLSNQGQIVSGVTHVGTVIRWWWNFHVDHSIGRNIVGVLILDASPPYQTICCLLFSSGTWFGDPDADLICFHGLLEGFSIKLSPD